MDGVRRLGVTQTVCDDGAVKEVERHDDARGDRERAREWLDAEFKEWNAEVEAQMPSHGQHRTPDGD
jgi:hypothetical protein